MPDLFKPLFSPTLLARRLTGFAPTLSPDLMAKAFTKAFNAWEQKYPEFVANRNGTPL